MTTKDLDQISQRREVASQATAIEQTRAIAEVQAAIVLAQQAPRDTARAMAAMQEACDQKALADRAFFSYSRAGSTINGPSIHLARELARCWANIQYGIAELRRDDSAGISEMRAYAWDVELNTMSSSIFIVPHARDTKQGRKPIVDLRDVYENNANQGARRVREAIFAVLPIWFTEAAKTRAMETIKHGGGKPLATRITDAIRLFDEMGVSLERIEDRLGKPSTRWSPNDVAQLVVLYQSLQHGELRVEDEFPHRRVTAAEIQERQVAGDPAPPESAGWPEVAQPGSKGEAKS